MKFSRGFSLFEVLIGILITLLLLLATYSVFILSQKTERPIANRAEITQNQRAILDRMTRELRQATAIVTTLPANEIKFEDGHDIINQNPIQYIRYYVTNNNLWREVSYYYFPTDPSTHVRYNELDENGLPPQIQLIETKLIGEYINSLTFTGGAIITISLQFTKNDQNLIIITDVSPRNIN